MTLSYSELSCTPTPPKERFSNSKTSQQNSPSISCHTSFSTTPSMPKPSKVTSLTASALEYPWSLPPIPSAPSRAIIPSCSCSDGGILERWTTSLVIFSKHDSSTNKSQTHLSRRRKSAGKSVNQPSISHSMNTSVSNKRRVARQKRRKVASIPCSRRRRSIQ